MTITYKNQVVIITGGGGSIGSAYVKAFAGRGAKVVINDPGTMLDGRGSESNPALLLSEQICASGGEAIANTDSIAEPEGAKHLIEQTMDMFGRIDVVINNAGNMRDKVFKKMNLDDFENVLRVHLFGSTYVSRAVFPVMITQNYGRILMTTSAAGLYGAFGGASYATAKAGVIGLMRTLSIEGKRHNIHTNAIAPIASSRMMDTLKSLVAENRADEMSPEAICPLALYLCSRDSMRTGDIIEAGGGYFAKVEMVEGAGISLPVDEALTPELISDCYPDIINMEKARSFQDMDEALKHAMSLRI